MQKFVFVEVLVLLRKSASGGGPGGGANGNGNGDDSAGMGIGVDGQGGLPGQAGYNLGGGNALADYLRRALGLKSPYGRNFARGRINIMVGPPILCSTLINIFFFTPTTLDVNIHLISL